MIVVSMMGSPSAGKSTLAAEVFSTLKKQGVKAELVTEYVKDAVYSKNEGALGDQFYLTAKQNHRLMRLRGKVDVVVTDTCLLNAEVYCEYYKDETEMKVAQVAGRSAASLYETYDNILVYVKRNKPYAKYGRTQTEEEANKIGKDVEKFLYDYEIPHIVSNSAEEIVDVVLDNMK